MKSKRSKNITRNSPNSLEKEWQAWLKEQPCCVTGRHGVDVHHIFGATYRHNKRDIGHISCIPLSPDMHRGMDGIHTVGKKRWRETWGNECAYFMAYYEKWIEQGGLPFDELDIHAVMDHNR